MIVIFHVDFCPAVVDDPFQRIQTFQIYRLCQQRDRETRI